MNLEVKLVPSGSLTSLVGNLQSYLLKSEAWTRGRATVDDIVRFLYLGLMNLWVVIDEDTSTVYGYVITEVKQYPACKVLVCQYCAGKVGIMNQIDDKMHDTLEKFALSAGCTMIEFFGRPGWKRFAKRKGYQVETIIYEKSI